MLPLLSLASALVVEQEEERVRRDESKLSKATTSSSPEAAQPAASLGDKPTHFCQHPIFGGNPVRVK